MRIVAALCLIFVTLPIWLYLLYKILVMINATELMFFLYWVYVLVSVFSAFVLKATESKS